MFVIFENGTATCSFQTMEDAVAYWEESGGTIVLYPDLTASSVRV